MKRYLLGGWVLTLLICLSGAYPSMHSAPLVPQISNLTLGSSSGLDITHDDLICSYDLAGTATTAATAWYVGTSTVSPLMGLYMPMEGGATNALLDYSGTGITAVTHGNPVWSASAGHDGKGAWVLDGNDDLSAGENFPVGSSYTNTAWVYRTGSGNNGGNNIIAGDANTGGHAFWAPDMYGNKLSAGHNGTWNSVQDPVALGLNTWYFVALTYNNDTKQMVLYKNGAPVSTATVTAAVTDATISIGSFGYSNGYMWKGTLDDVRVYKRALSPEQILSLYYDGADVIKHTETEVGDIWQARVTSFSATEAGPTESSNMLTIQDGSPIAPAIVSTPVTTATAGEAYAYDADATGSPAPTYALTTAPAGMTINAYTGLVQWTPTATGSYPVTISATNSAGSTTQPYTVVVSAGPVPEIENLALTSTSGSDLTTDDLTCGYDLAGTATTAATAWYVGTSTVSPLMGLYMPMEGGATNALLDYSGTGITAVTHGNPVWSASAGHDGKGAWVLDGNDDLSAGENFPVGSSYTNTAWVYRTGSGNNGGNNIIAGDANTGGHAFWAPDMYGNKLSAGHNGTWNSVQDPVALGLNTWYFVALTYNNDTKQMVLYKNGAPVSTATVTAAVTDATISIGSFGYSNGYMWKGTLDDVRIYKRALSPEQILSLYYDGADVIKHTETQVGEIWQARVTSFSATEAGTTESSNTLTIQDGSPIAPAIVSTPVTTATAGEAYAYDADATGSPAPTYALTTAPAGMTINAYTGLVQWTPTATGSYPVTVSATNSAGAATQPYTVVVSAGPVPEIENLALTSTSGSDLTTDDLTCGYDLAGTATTAATAWYVGTPTVSPLMGLYMPMEGGATNALLDYSGTGITAVTHGNPVWSASAGHDGKGAWVLDGNDDLSAGENFPVGSSYTNTAWVYRTGSGNNGGNNIVAGDANSGGHAFWAPDSYGNKLSAGHNGTWNSVQDPVALGLNTWYFVALTYNNDTKQMVLYKNGTPVSTATVTAAVTDATISIGSFGYSNGYMWKGTLDDVRIYKRALTAEQIRSLYVSGSNVIKQTETEVGDSWQARVTPFSATAAGLTYESNTIVIQGAAVAPVITSTPVTDAAVGELYTYDVDATGNPAPSYALVEFPTGMTIDGNTGLIEWTPPAAGSVPVAVRAFNTAGSDTQSYAITVPPPPGVTNLVLTSTYGKYATTDDLLCQFDLDGPAVTSATAWYVGNSPLSPLMVLYLPFEGGTSHALEDYSGNGFDATPHGNPTWSATGGHDGHGAFEFDGDDDLGAGEHFPTGASYTKTAWVYRTGSGANGGNNIVAGDENTGGHAFWAPDLFGNKLSAGHNYTWDIVQDAVALGLNQWYFVAVSFDYSTGVMKLYKDGVVVDSAVLDPADRDVTDATISVGSFGASNGWMWKGFLDDVRIYNRALSLDQVLALYNSGANVVASAETEIGEQWCACVTPFSATAAGETACTDTITVMDESVPVFLRTVDSRWVNGRVEVAWSLHGTFSDIAFQIDRAGVDGEYTRLLGVEITRRGDDYVFVDDSVEAGEDYTYRVSVWEDGREVASFETSPGAPALEFSLSQNHPNPFNPTTTISFSLDADADVALRVYDVSGKLVRTVVDRRMKAGVHVENWDGRDDRGDEAVSGIYFYRLVAGDRALTRKAVLLK